MDPKHGISLVKDTVSPHGNDLYLGADAPAWVYSTAPLAQPSGAPVAAPTPGSAGHAMALSDQQVLILQGFADFPANELTVEFWMQSVDGCRKGVPFSYAVSAYGEGDNAVGSRAAVADLPVVNAQYQYPPPTPPPLFCRAENLNLVRACRCSSCCSTTTTGASR